MIKNDNIGGCMGRKTKKMNRKWRTLAITLLFSIGVSQVVYARTYTASNFTEYQAFLQQGLASYEEVITIHYQGNERFLETEIGGKLSSLYYASAQELSDFDEQNIYSIRMLSSSNTDSRKYPLKIARYEMQYKNSAKELEQVDAIIKEVIKGDAFTAKDPYESIKAAYDYVLSSYYYQKLAASDAETADILLERNLLRGLTGTQGVVCDAYVMLLSKMLTAQGFENTIVMGTAYDELHVWNKVKLDDGWYNIEPTWGDSSTPGNKEKYFLTSDEVLFNNGHVWDLEKYPVAPSIYQPLGRAR
jgi:transglutaminase-like putative cysteine protease